MTYDIESTEYISHLTRIKSFEIMKDIGQNVGDWLHIKGKNDMSMHRKITAKHIETEILGIGYCILSLR